jgi:D-glycero-D-manno-heptose 1,7-bisphosphate phosphatase
MSRRCVFLDRDGVINEKAPPHEYVRSWTDFRFLPNIVDWIRLFNALGYLVIVISNQRGVARGMMSAADVEDIHRRMTAELAKHGAILNDIYYCPHEEGECDCRKPQPGLVLQASEKWDIDLAESLLIGDADSDAELAMNCGVRFLRVEGGRIV